MSDEETTTRLVAVIDGASTLLGVQALLAGLNEEGESPPKAVDDFSLGYVFGFVDVMLQRAGFHQDDPNSFVATTMVFENVFGSGLGSTYFWSCAERQGPHHREVFRGARAGGQEAWDFLTQGTAKSPMGWPSHVLD
jgi:hypothetical protein